MISRGLAVAFICQIQKNGCHFIVAPILFIKSNLMISFDVLYRFLESKHHHFHLH